MAQDKLKRDSSRSRTPKVAVERLVVCEWCLLPCREGASWARPLLSDAMWGPAWSLEVCADCRSPEPGGTRGH